MTARWPWQDEYVTVLTGDGANGRWPWQDEYVTVLTGDGANGRWPWQDEYVTVLTGDGHVIVLLEGSHGDMDT